MIRDKQMVVCNCQLCEYDYHSYSVDLLSRIKFDRTHVLKTFFVHNEKPNKCSDCSFAFCDVFLEEDVLL